MPFAFDEFSIDKEINVVKLLRNRYKMSMGEAQKTIDRGRVLCNGVTIKDKKQKICGNIKVLIFKPLSRGLKPILQTKDLMIFDKPSGVAVHPKKVVTPYSMLDEIRTFGTNKSNAAHRIDKETSGLLIACKNRQTEVAIKQLFEKKEVKKTYLAWVRGNTKKSFFVDAPIKQRFDYSTNKHKVEINSEGKSAQTKFTKLLYNEQKDASLLLVEPLTGRTHQIRIHLFHVKHPILGDPLYGTSFEVAEKYLEKRLSDIERLKYTGAPRLMLHANSLEFTYKNRFFIKSQVDFKEMVDLIADREMQLFNKE